MEDYIKFFDCFLDFLTVVLLFMLIRDNTYFFKKHQVLDAKCESNSIMISHIYNMVDPTGVHYNKFKDIYGFNDTNYWNHKAN